MTAALRALLSGVIDYAGLFPPAKLPLEEAVREYLAIRESPEAWMLNTFVIPASRVEELEEWKTELFGSEGPMQLSLLGRNSDSVSDWESQLEADLRIVGRFLKRNDTGVAVHALELPLPEAIQAAAESGSELKRVCSSVAKAVQCISPSTRRLYFEAPWVLTLDGVNSGLGDAFACQVLDKSRLPCMGLKLRTGGMTADAFPSTERLAEVVQICADRKNSFFWKATAGLHHPFPHFDATLGARMHGFLNLLFAVVLTTEHELSRDTIQQILEDEDATRFVTSDAGIQWQDFGADISSVKEGRTCFQSFGSCSFDEPRDDLKKLGLL